MMYDETAGYIETPAGKGKFVEYDSNSKVVLVEMDEKHLVYFSAEDCYILI